VAFGNLDQLCPSGLPEMCLIGRSEKVEIWEEWGMEEWCENICEYVREKTSDPDNFINGLNDSDIWEKNNIEFLKRQYETRVAISYQIEKNDLPKKICGLVPVESEKKYCFDFIDFLKGLDPEEKCSNVREDMENLICANSI